MSDYPQDVSYAAYLRFAETAVSQDGKRCIPFTESEYDTVMRDLYRVNPKNAIARRYVDARA